VSRSIRAAAAVIDASSRDEMETLLLALPYG